MNQVILVDEHNQPTGVADKLQAHQQGLLHRAFSVFVVRQQNQAQEILMQQRQTSKYHSGGLWTNTCCSHPQPGETIITAAERRLQEELGFTLPLTEVGVFTYRAELGNGLIEHEIDHVLVGKFHNNLTIKPNIDEVMAFRWLTFNDAIKEYEKNPTHFTPWFAEALAYVKKHCS